MTAVPDEPPPGGDRERPVVIVLPSLSPPKGVCTGCLGRGECWICDGGGCHRCATSGTCHLCLGTGRDPASPTPSQRPAPREGRPRH